MKPNWKKLLLTYFPYLIFAWLFNKAGQCYRLAAGNDLVTNVLAVVSGLGAALSRNPLPSLHPRDLLVGLIGAAGLRLAVYFKAQNAKKFRHGREYGSARWGYYHCRTAGNSHHKSPCRLHYRFCVSGYRKKPYW